MVNTLTQKLPLFVVILSIFNDAIISPNFTDINHADGTS